MGDELFDRLEAEMGDAGAEAAAHMAHEVHKLGKILAVAIDNQGGELIVSLDAMLAMPTINLAYETFEDEGRTLVRVTKEEI